MLRTKVVAAVDFGTHSSGYAWSVISDQNRVAKNRQIKTRTQWPGQPVASAKNLSSLLLSKEREVLAWGFDALRRARADPSLAGDYIHGFKMRLADRPIDVAEATLSEHLDAADVVHKYLSEIYRTALSDIRAAGYQAEEIRWCITVPAIWNEYQKQLMRDVAVKAGFPVDENRLILALEPEAAAHHARIAGVRTLGATGGRRANLMSAGSRFMVADCGGGTVDLTAYRTAFDGRLVEIGRDFGGAFGSEYLNKVFGDKVLSNRLGSYRLLASIIREKPAAFDEILASWERAKLHVKLGHDTNLFISIPAAIDRILPEDACEHLRSVQDGIDDHIVLTPPEVTEIFESVVPGVLELIDRQLREMAKGASRTRPPLIVLVGGFGSSGYLQERMAKHVEGRAEVLLPPEPAVAVLYGATHFAYEPQTAARRSKLTYGCETSLDFLPGLHPEHRAFLADERKMCGEIFDRFVRSGQVVPTDEVVRRTYTPVYKTQDGMTIRILQSQSANPMWTDDDGVEQIGELYIDFESMMHLDYAHRKAEVAMYFGETSIRVEAHVPNTEQRVETKLSFSAKVGI